MHSTFGRLPQWIVFDSLLIDPDTTDSLAGFKDNDLTPLSHALPGSNQSGGPCTNDSYAHQEERLMTNPSEQHH